MEEDDKYYILDVVHSVLNVLDRLEESRDNSTDFQPLVFKLDYLQRLLVGLNIDDSIVEMVGQAHNVLLGFEQLDQRPEAVSRASTVRTGRRGRPSFDVKEEQLSYLLEQGFKVSDISKVVGVSQRTVERRMSTFGLSVSGMYSDISDKQLDEYVVRASSEHPNIGLRMIKGYLQSKGMRVQRSRIRSALLRTDPIGLLERWQKAIKRRCYNVKFPLSLWHIDGNHKLIRWRFVIHGGIDGFSRIPVYLKASNNNRASTVVRLFTEAVSEYGLPSRVRSDKGGENVDVSAYMLSHPRRGPGRGSMITGRSTHNQRIERLWRDLFGGCLSLFYDLFYAMENQNILNAANESHLWCLHYVFSPIINRHIKNWKDAWVNHPIRTEKNKTPMQLWVTGLQLAGNLQASGTDSGILQDEDANYGVDWQGPIPGPSPDLVEVPETTCPFASEDQVATLPQTMELTYLEGVEAFQNIVQLIGEGQ